MGSFKPGLPGDGTTVTIGPDRSPVEERGVTDPAPLPVAPANKGRAVTATLSAPLCLDPKVQRDGDRADEIVEWGKALAAKANRLSSIPGRTLWRESMHSVLLF